MKLNRILQYHFFKASSFLLLFLMLNTIANAQQNSPVAGDIAILIDLLKKDYNSINPETRSDEIISDRARVIGIFNSYLKRKLLDTDLKKAIFDGVKATVATDNNGIGCDFLTELDAYVKEKEKLDALSRTSINLDKNTYIKYENVLTVVNTKRENYYKAAFCKDTNELKDIAKIYGTNNSYLNYCVILFIDKYTTINKGERDIYSETNYQSSIQKSLPFLGGDLAFETIIDGLSRFLVKRIKEELTTYVIQKVQEELNNPSPESYLNELMVLLPRTTIYLKSFDADQVLNFVDELKQYIEDDLNHMLENASGLRNTPRFQQLIATNPDIDFAFEALELIPQLSKLENPIDYFDILANSKNLTRWRSFTKEHLKDNKNAADILRFNVANSIYMSAMFAHSLTVLENGEVKFVSTDFMSSYGSEINFYLLYIGFMHQQNIKYYNIKFKKKNTDSLAKLSFDNLMKKVEPKENEETRNYAKKVQNTFTKIAVPAEKLYRDAITIKKAKTTKEGVPYATIHAFTKGIIGLSEAIIGDTAELINDLNETGLVNEELNFSIKDKTKHYFSVAHTANNILLDLHQEKYSTAIIKALEIHTNFKKDPSNGIKEYANSESISTALNVLQNNTNVNTIANLIRFKEYPTAKEDIDKLNNYALKASVLSNKIKWNSSFFNKKLYKETKAFITLINDIKEAKTDVTKQKHYKSLIAKFKTSYKAISTLYIDDAIPLINKITGLDIKELAYQSVNNAIEKSTVENKDKLKKVLNENIEAYLKTTIGIIITKRPANISELREEDGYKNAEQQLKNYLSTYLPELAQATFNITDKNTIRLVHFINDIAIADNAEDVEAAIDAFALPAGSFALKQKKGDYVAINAFPGFLGGIEQTDLFEGESVFSLGFTAPIGLYSKITNKLGVFVPIIDIAAPVRFRFDGDSDTKALPEFTFKNILSPGLYFTYSPWKSPLTFTFGAQYGPEFEKIIENNSEITTGETTAIITDSFRVGIGITLDIPLVTLFNRPK